MLAIIGEAVNRLEPHPTEVAMAQSAQNVIQHDFGFPRLVRREDEERAALDALLGSLGATKGMAERLMEDFPQHGTACQAIVDFAGDGEGDIRGALAALDDEAPWHLGWSAAAR
jgi:hypothetical protein